jgi:UDP:flavonoid glycosyltransferase YjiC (YdhE family)
MFSLKEALCAGVPTLTMSLFAEQSRNSFMSHQSGIGQSLNKANLTGDELKVCIFDENCQKKISKTGIYFRQKCATQSPSLGTNSE